MKCSVYLPPKAEVEKVPVLYWLSGLTCTHENFITKAGAQQVASELELMLIAPDTSPREAGVEGEEENDWILIDYSDVVVHLMMPQVREFYSLERLWNDHLGEVVQHRRDTFSDS